jgi:outer membrane immunogenic protein
MNKFMIAGALACFAVPALGADLPVKAPPIVVPAEFSWTGFYLGAHAGVAFSSETTRFTGDQFLGQFLFVPFAQNGFFEPPLANQLGESGTSFLGGAQIGYNWQFDKRWVIGFEADFSWLNARGSSSSTESDTSVPPGPIVVSTFTMQYQEKIEWLSTLRARLGYAPAERLLVYGTGGLAIARVNQTLTYAHTAGIVNADDLFGAIVPGAGGGLVCLTFGGPCLAGAATHNLFGWAAGGGAEYALTSHVSLKGEYLFVSLENGSVSAFTTNQFHPGFTNSPLVFIRATGGPELQIARVGVNLRF